MDISAGERGKALRALFGERYGDRRGAAWFSAPGRTEIGGNHTDHQRGRVLCAAVNLDVLALAARWDEPYISLYSAHHGENRVALDDLEPRAEPETPRSNALIRGMLAKFRQLGLPVGGFCAVTHSEVLNGSGLSSSAAFEVLVCTMLDHLYGAGTLDSVQIAQIAQYAENVYFRKPSGLMDQLACAAGGLIAADFRAPDAPELRRLDADLNGLTLCVVAPGGDHAGLTEEYAAIPGEMGRVARALGAEVLRDAEETAFMLRLPELRASCGDRAVLRALHFFAENRRAALQADALENGDLPLFLSLVRESGRSSCMYLQNVFAPGDPRQQSLTLALALSERLLGRRGAYRVHGGGFAGTIQAFVPRELTEAYQSEMDAVFGPGSCLPLTIRRQGGVRLGTNN